MRTRLGAKGGGGIAAPQSVKFINSGCTVLDQALGGGWAERRIINIVGDRSSGKTLLAIEASANFHQQHPKGRILYRESEAAFDKGYAASLGMPIEAVDFGPPMNTVEQFFEDVSKATKSTKPTLYVLDSLDALSDDAELERGLSEPTYGADKARKLSQLFRRLEKDANLTLIIISQIRSKLSAAWGRKTTRSGGMALDFYASQVLYLSHQGSLSKTIDGVKRPVGLKINTKVDKNKVGPPLREANFTLQFGYGIDDLTSCVNWLAEVGKLNDIGLSSKKGEMTDFIKRVNMMSDTDYWQELARVQAKVRDRWNMIETTFLPKRQKYNG